MSEPVSYLNGLVEFLASPGAEKTSFTVLTSEGQHDLTCYNSLIPKNMKVSQFWIFKVFS